MNRSSNFFIGLVAAIVTFGMLTLTLGPKHAMWNRHHHGWHGVRSYDNHHGNDCGEDHESQNENGQRGGE